VSAFYLSINPTKRFLQQMETGSRTVPTGALQYGSGPSPAGLRNNEVVTAGGIETSIIGDILWRADVAFKSASLGYSVLTGTKFVQTTGSLVALGNGDDEDFETDYENRWCRLYWTSGAQQIGADPTLRTVRFSGDALAARAEPMELVNGELKDQPKGTWCAEPKRVAARLQVAANARRSTFSELNQLQRLAEAQNFARWASENGIQTTAAFRKALQTSASVRVTLWTSGVRSEPQHIVQVEQRLTANPWVMGLHYGTTDISAVKPCISASYGSDVIDRAFQDMGFRKDLSGVWRYTPAQKPLFAKWMTGVASKIAKCSNRIVLPPSGDTAEEINAMTDSGTVGEEIVHSQPVDIHGGILLVKFADLARKQMLADGRLAVPDGRMLFSSVGEELHFWNLATSHGTIGPMSHHVTLTAGTVVDLETADNRLRVPVKGAAGAILRQELRVHQTPKLLGGLEWLEARFASNNDTIASEQGGLALRRSREPLCRRCSSLRTAKLLGASEGDAPPITVEHVGPDLWVVDIDISHVRTMIDAQASSRTETDTGKAIGLVSQYATWGFINEAENLQQTAKPPTTFCRAKSLPTASTKQRLRPPRRCSC
jgi:hypothetical protein